SRQTGNSESSRQEMQRVCPDRQQDHSVCPDRQLVGRPCELDAYRRHSSHPPVWMVSSQVDSRGISCGTRGWVSSSGRGRSCCRVCSISTARLPRSSASKLIEVRDGQTYSQKGVLSVPTRATSCGTRIPRRVSAPSRTAAY